MASLNLDKIRLALEKVPKEFKDLVAQVGIPSNPHYPETKNNPGGTSVATVAAIHEFGAPASNIPARPFIRPTVKEQKDNWTKIVASRLPAVARGEMSAFDVLDLVGRQAAADIKETISKVNSPPLKPATIARKGSAKPLIDTGYMLASVQNSVAPEGSEFTGNK